MKLGGLPSFSLPVLVTCPGQTPFCNRYCYGLKGRFINPRIKQLHDEHLDATLRGDFVDRIVYRIRITGSPAFRLHVVGDFYSVEYIEKWMEIANRLPLVIFFSSTRSWRCEYLSDKLKEFRDLSNVYIKASVDLTHTDQPHCGWRVWSVEGKGTPCPHDHGLVGDCLTCKRCWTIKDYDLCVKLRWGRKGEYMTPRLFN